MSYCLIGLGSNLGDRREAFEEALRQLDRCVGIVVVRHSQWHETRPCGGPAGQPSYLNGVALLETTLEPLALWAALVDIERQLGRLRDVRWGPRTLDLDLLVYDELVLAAPELTVPHPRMAWRRFVLEPAAEIATAMLHPLTGWTIGRLLEHLNTAIDYIAIAGTIAVGKTLLAGRVAQRLGARLVVEQVAADRLEAFYGNPTGNAWAMELEFLRQRRDLLAADGPGWSNRGQYTVSDFWFDQSRAFASYWLPPGQMGQYLSRWDEARQKVVRPKLIVMLEAPLEQLRKRIQQRGRRGEQDLSPQTLEDIHRAILAETTRADQGPVLHLVNEDPESALDEVSAAVESMR